jgi:hypothetical protein
MPEHYVNHGVQITGGTVSGAVAAGPNSRVVQNLVSPAASPQTATAAELMARIRTLIDDHEGRLENPRAIRRDAEQIEAELAEEEPDREFLSDGLARLSRRVSSVAVLAETVAALIQLVTG